jgi:hypothetical protein
MIQMIRNDKIGWKKMGSSHHKYEEKNLKLSYLDNRLQRVTKI